jgi:hypothetical protein
MEHYGDAEKEDRRHGYSAGRLQFEENREILRHWPRRATYDPVNGPRFIRDEENCVLDESDGGTHPDEIPLVRGGAGDPRDRLEDVMAQSLDNYHRHVQKHWDDRWSGEIGDAGHD